MSKVYTEKTALELLYQGRTLQRVPFEQHMVEQFNSVCDELELQPICSTVDHGTQFQIPEHYRELDVETYIRARIMDDLDGAATARVEQELELYRARNLYPVLQTLIYIVDTMRKNGIVWGVGRGSSVASYCLYLIGVHSIDSIKYDLDIQEFFKQR
jgi:DNA polymerase III alpha subunit